MSLLNWCSYKDTTRLTHVLSTWFSATGTMGSPLAVKPGGDLLTKVLSTGGPFVQLLVAQLHFFPNLGLTRSVTSFQDDTSQRPRVHQSRVLSPGVVYWSPIGSDFLGPSLG